jgi:hypothetical protein
VGSRLWSYEGRGVLTAEPQTVELTEDARTESGEACVEMAREFAAALGGGRLGEDPYQIRLPTDGGTIRTGFDPFWCDVTVKPAE